MHSPEPVILELTACEIEMDIKSKNDRKQQILSKLQKL